MEVFWVFSIYIMWVSGRQEFIYSEFHDDKKVCNQHKELLKQSLLIEKQNGDVIAYTVNPCIEVKRKTQNESNESEENNNGYYW